MHSSFEANDTTSFHSCVCTWGVAPQRPITLIATTLPGMWLPLKSKQGTVSIVTQLEDMKIADHAGYLSVRLLQVAQNIQMRYIKLPTSVH